ncbi:MAG: hypothetical protein FWC60_09280 [Firmicutes bacterium]|nr:hypothetical protein [Bacillota bacterium]
MLFDRYGEIITSLEELGARIGTLNNRDRQIMQNLLEEQEWLSVTLVKRAKFLLEEIDRSFEKLFDWMIAFSDLLDRASGHGGTPAEVLRMKKMMQDADDLREQLNRMVTDRSYNEDDRETKEAPADGEQGEPLTEPVSQTRREAAAAANTVGQAPIPPTTVKTSKPQQCKKNKVRDLQHHYLPPKELLTALEQKMAPPAIAPKAKSFLAIKRRMT